VAGGQIRLPKRVSATTLTFTSGALITAMAL
jgi:hypothetical protein